MRVVACSIRRWRRAGRQCFASKLFKQVELTRAMWTLFEMFGNKRPLAAIQQPLLICGKLFTGWAEHTKKLLAEQPLHVFEHMRALRAVWTVAQMCHHVWLCLAVDRSDKRQIVQGYRPAASLCGLFIIHHNTLQIVNCIPLSSTILNGARSVFRTYDFLTFQ